MHAPEPSAGATQSAAEEAQALAHHDALVAALAAALGAEAGRAPIAIDTHLSSVIVSGGQALKIKKPVRLPFVDLSDFEVRRRLCEEEVRLNRRLAPSIYLDVVPVLGDLRHPRLGQRAAREHAPGDEPVLAHAVRMRAFDQSALWSAQVPAGAVTPRMAYALGARLAAFHADTEVVHQTGIGDAASVEARIERDIDELRTLAPAPSTDELATRLRRAFAAAKPLIDARWHAGRVRDGHGDLHLANVVTLDGEAVAFDCLEFDRSLRCTDVIADLAFLTMDLQHAGRADLAFQVLDGWLDISGDHEGIALLRLFEAMRATVRGKVAAVHARQREHGVPPGGVRAHGAAATPLAFGYLDLARRLLRPRRARLVITHGLPGSGKTHASTILAARLGAVRLRSDVERKRMSGRAVDDHGGAHGDMYAQSARQRVYDELERRAEPLLAAGLTVIVDAGFPSRAQRAHFAGFAARMNARFAILHCAAPLATLRERLVARSSHGRDASDADVAVLEARLGEFEPLTPAERRRAVRLIDPVSDGGIAAVHRLSRTDGG